MSYSFIYTNSVGERTEVFARNVASKNPDAALQFEIQQQRGESKRNYYFCFNLPASEIKRFIEAISKE